MRNAAVWANEIATGPKATDRETSPRCRVRVAASTVATSSSTSGLSAQPFRLGPRDDGRGAPRGQATGDE